MSNTTEPIGNLYGDAKLLEAAPWYMSGVFVDEGSTFLPLGHNPGDRSLGYAFNLDQSGFTPGHGIFFGATRSGKGVSSIIPALLTTSASCVSIDPKGELAWITAPRRRAMGHRVVILDPWNEVNERYGVQVGESETITKFNPLSALDPTDRNFNDDVTALADALILTNPDLASHWNDSAKALVAGLIAAAVELNPGKASLRDVRQLITSSDEELVAHVLAIRQRNPDSLAARKLRRFAKTRKVKNKKTGEITTKVLTSSAEIGSIRSTAETQTDLLDSAVLLDAMETDAPPFNLAELVTGPVTVYLVLPPDKLSTHGRWLRMILTLALRIIARQRKPPALPVLFILDEMGTIGPLRPIEDSYGLLAGLGVRIAGYLQDLSQLQRDYPHSWETFISNSSVIGLLQCADKTTADYFSDYLGTQTVNAKTGSWSYKQSRWEYPEQFAELHQRETDRIYNTYGPPAPKTAGVSPDLYDARKNPEGRRVASANAATNELREKGYTPIMKTGWEPDQQLASRPVLYPYEVRNSPPEKMIIIAPGKYNLRLQRFVYYSDPVLSKWARHDPNKPAPVVIEDPAPAPQPIVQVQAAPPPTPPANDNRPKAPQSVGAELGSMVGGFLKRKLDEKLGGK